MTNIYTNQPMEQVILDLIQFKIAMYMSPGLLKCMEVNEAHKYLTNELAVQIKFFLLGNEVHTEEFDDTVITYPATMWEDLKESIAPRWFLRKFPVRYSRDVTHRTVKHFKVCPHLDIPDQDTHIRFLTNRTIQEVNNDQTIP